MENETKPTCGSLFAGIIGIDIGFEAEGFTTEWYIEKDPFCQAIIKKNKPDADIHGDIKEVSSGSLRRVNVLHGGFPCQDISNAGKRAGIEGSRSSLWKDFAEKIRVLLPDIVLIENVSALVNRGLDVVLADLAKIGYDAEWHCISASSVGAPHRRERVFIIAYPKSRCNAENKIQTGRTELDVCNNVSNTLRSELEGVRKGRNSESSIRKGQEKPMCGVTNWSTEPELGRVADGIPDRVDRIKALGNAVVPQCAQVFARAIRRINY